MRLILASTSKFKNEILNKVGIKHASIPSKFIEKSNSKENVYQYVQELSLGKVKSVEDKFTDHCIILGLDTIVYVNDQILEKPKDLDEAKKYLRMSANNTTSVITDITLLNKDTNEIVQDYQETKITLRKIAEEDIAYYIEHEPDIMCASGFIVEGIISNFIDKIEGSFYNILGVPVEKIYEYLLKWNVHLHDLENCSDKRVL